MNWYLTVNPVLKYLIKVQINKGENNLYYHQGTEEYRSSEVA